MKVCEKTTAIVLNRDVKNRKQYSLYLKNFIDYFERHSR